MQKKLGNNAVTLPVQGSQFLYGVLYANPSFIKEHSNTTQRFVRALVQTEEYIDNNPVELKIFLAKQFKYSDDYVASVLSKFHFTTALNQALLLAMENEARFVIANKLTDKTKVPNYLDFIYLDALKAVKPSAVTIIK